MNTQTIVEHQRVVEQQRVLKNMLNVAKSLPPSEKRDQTIVFIEVKLMLLKQYLNSVY